MRAKNLRSIVDSYYTYLEDGYFEDKQETYIGYLSDVYNDIGDYGCIAKDENMFIFEGEDFYPNAENDNCFIEKELIEINKRINNA